MTWPTNTCQSRELQVAAMAQELDFFLSALPDHDDTWHKKDVTFHEEVEVEVIGV